MREYGDSANIAKSRGLAIQGGVFGFALAFISVLTFRIGPIEASLVLVPLAAIFLWPRGSSQGLSSVFIFATGLMVDIISAGPPGLWAFVYLALYGAFQPDKRSGTPRLKTLWPEYCFWVAVAVVIVLTIGRLFVEGRTSIGPLLMMGFSSALVFPVFFGIRQGLRQIVSDSDDAGYAR